MTATAIRSLKVRRVNFNFEGTPVHWFKGNPIATHFQNAFHCIFPDGEKFFIRSVLRYKDKIGDPELKKQIDNFCGQEGTHYKEHQKFWKILEQQGFDVDKFVRFYTGTLYGSFEKNALKNMGELGNKLALSSTVAAEHFTAILAASSFEDISRYDDLPEDMKKLMLWHAAEEIEHKALPFNVLREIDDSYTLRIAGMLMASWALWSYNFVGTMMFLSQDKELQYNKLPKYLMQFMVGFGSGPGRGLMKSYFKYYKPGFHPDQIDNYHMAKEYLEANGLS